MIRDKRDIVYDKQLELESRDYDPSEYLRVESAGMFRRGRDDTLEFNDRYYHDQWYCVSWMFVVLFVCASFTF